MALKRCLMCRKRLWRKYDEVRYNTTDGVRTAYLCLPHAEEVIREGQDIDGPVRISERSLSDEEGLDPDE